jgi:glycosyltransferase involved in cell wall biosynthesis
VTSNVSVIVTTYRRVERLDACLAGLRSQTWPAEEVVVVVHVSDYASADHVERLTADWPELRSVRVDRAGSVAALNRGLAAARASIVAFVDDDAVPAPDWLERIVCTFAQDERIAAVGGRDHVIVDGQVFGAESRRPGPTVGRIQWFGRMIGNHHVGVGAARDVDVLKGANMSFRRAAAAEHAFDDRLRGGGAQVHSELSICLPLRRRHLRVIYDPQILVTHSPAPRPHGDRRHDRAPATVHAFAHNETLAVLDYFGPMRRLVYAAWGLAIGTSYCPGLVVLARDGVTGRRAAWPRFVAAQRGRAAAWKTHRAVPRLTPSVDETAAPAVSPTRLGSTG